MTDGKLEESDMQWIDSRMLDNFVEDEKSNFDQDLVVTWKEAKPIVLEYCRCQSCGSSVIFVESPFTSLN